MTVYLFQIYTYRKKMPLYNFQCGSEYLSLYETLHKLQVALTLDPRINTQVTYFCNGSYLYQRKKKIRSSDLLPLPLPPSSIKLFCFWLLCWSLKLGQEIIFFHVEYLNFLSVLDQNLTRELQKKKHNYNVHKHFYNASKAA